ncbi:MAG TPA: DNA polymerase ligase N-terminal domain-containing protein [Tepidisphaeraceae bacterium]|jgi:bifunctional non-homologous end joining protein LigD
MPAKNSSSKKLLKEYQRKRNFATTPEPSGAKSPPKKAKKQRELFFCVQKHLASHLHYDFRLEHHGVLLSWAVPKGPSLNPKDKRLAMKVEDHPFDYGEFEGVIPEGYGAGIVMLWDRGTWQPENGDVDGSLARGELKFSLQGVKLKGSWVLVRTGGGGGGGGESRTWLLIKHRDQWAGNVDVTRFDKSVKGFGDFAEILAEEKPHLWESHRPAKGGAAGEMLQEIIEQAAALKAKRESGAMKKRSVKKPKPAKRVRQARATAK